MRTPSLLRLPRDWTRLAAGIGIALYAVGSLAYLELGQVNSDEGWYLYGSRLVFQGALPYGDFAYTQMPLLPYVYGVLQILRPSLFLGRLTSVLISLGTLGMSFVIARRYGGARAGAIVTFLFAAFTIGIYFNSIVKTYALLSFFFTATLFVLSSQLTDTVKYPLALMYALAAALVRVTALFFVPAVLAYAWIAGRDWRTRALILLETAAASVTAAFFLLPDWPTAQWDLIDSHLNRWGDISALGRIMAILTDRLPDIVQNFGPVLFLFGASLYFILRRRQAGAFLREHMPPAIVFLGLVLFAASHLVNGVWVEEYLVPAVTASLPILAILLSQVYGELESQSRIFVQGTLVAALLLFPLTETIQHVDVTGRRPPLAEIDQVAGFVAQHSKPTDKVVALEALGVVLDADRSVLPGFTLAQFSVQKVDTLTAERLHVVNMPMFLDIVDKEAARVIVLTDGDWDVLNIADVPSALALKQELEQHYELALTLPRFGQFAGTAYVYLSR